MLISRTPSSPLRPYVSRLWYAEAWRPEHACERIMPDGTANLMVMLDDGGAAPSTANMIVCGPRSSAAVLRSSGFPRALMGAHFSAGGLAAIIDVPPGALRDRQVALADLVGLAGAELRERLLAAATASLRLDLLEGWLGRRICQRPGADAGIVWAARRLERPSARVVDVAESLGFSGRWFAARFERDIGLTPKLFHRIRRFHGALRRVRGDSDPDLADLAVAAGYHDQAHFSHECMRLSGMSPAVLLAARTDHINHIGDRS